MADIYLKLIVQLKYQGAVQKVLYVPYVGAENLQPLPVVWFTGFLDSHPPWQYYINRYSQVSRKTRSSVAELCHL